MQPRRPQTDIVRPDQWVDAYADDVDEASTWVQPPGEISDLFAFCNHLAWQAGGPVLIHDADLGVVAYSTLQQPIDNARRAIILRRQVPDNEVERETTSVALELMRAGEESFEIPAYEGIQERRVIAPVFLGGVLVGSIWIAESAGPLHPEVHDMARTGSKQAALLFHLQDDARKREAEVFAGLLLDGSAEEELLAGYLGVPVRGPSCVIAVWHGGDRELRTHLPHVARAIFAEQSISFVGRPTDECFYAAVYDRPASADFAERTKRAAIGIADIDDRLTVGVGRTTGRLGHIPQSRQEADTVVTYLRRNPSSRVASLDSIRPDVTLMRILEILDGQMEPIQGPLRELSRLEDGDREDALQTLNAYFEFAGNATEAARSLCIHPNTFRYRLAKVVDMLDIDLTNRNSRLLLELDLMRHRYGR